MVLDVLDVIVCMKNRLKFITGSHKVYLSYVLVLPGIRTYEKKPMKLSRLKQALSNVFKSLFSSTDKLSGHFLPCESNIIIPIHQNSATANLSFSKIAY